MKKRLTVILLTLAMLFCVAARADEIKIKKFVFDPGSISIPKDYCWQAAFTLDPAGANEPVVWKSSDERIATVDQNGVITGIKKGDCKITVYTENGKHQKAQLRVKVKEFDAVLSMADTRVKVHFETTGGMASSRVQVGNRVSEISSETTVSFKNGCVRSDGENSLAPVKPGEDTVTVTETNKQNGKKKVNKKTYSVLVTQEPLLHKDEKLAREEAETVPLDIPAGSISFTDQDVLLAPATTWRLKMIAEPRGAQVRDVRWTSSNERVATVDANGVITGVGKGSAKITAALQNGTGPKAVVNVRVENYDLVFRDITPQYVQYSHGSGQFYITGTVKNGNVYIPDIDGYVSAIVSGGKAVKEVMVSPVKQGEDLVTISVNKKQFKFSVYVSQEVFSKPADDAEKKN